MIKLTSHCGICRFTFTNSNEKSLLEIVLNDRINTDGFILSSPTARYSVKGQMIGDNVCIVNYEGTTGEIFEANKLTYDPINKRVVKTSLLKHKPITSGNVALGLLTCDSVIKKFVGIYNIKQNITEVLSYETY
jgi:hypothetical protein